MPVVYIIHTFEHLWIISRSKRIGCPGCDETNIHKAPQEGTTSVTAPTTAAHPPTVLASKDTTPDEGRTGQPRDCYHSAENSPE